MAETLGADAVFPIAFLSLFELIGGLALGGTMQKIARSRFLPRMIASQAFILVWGVLFAGIPLIAGGSSWGLLAFLIQAAVFSAAWAFGFYFLDQIRELVALPWLWFAGFGGVFTVAGAATGFLAAPRDAALALMLGVSFGGVGVVLLVLGLVMMQRGSSARKEPDE